jgi:intracellular sulfur oxidation DsrE/DsrF family protein
MRQHHSSSVQNVISLVTMVALFSIATASSAIADGTDNALKGVKGIKAIFDYSQGSPKVSNIVFGAVKDLYKNRAVTSLAERPQIVIVFQGPAVKLITNDRSNFAEKDFAELDKFHKVIREVKKDGVKLEVCLYAAKVMGVDASTILPEIDHVGNGFISTIGYQTQGYALVRVP